MVDRGKLLQEEYVSTPHGSWKVLVVCQFLNRTTWVQAEPALVKFFEKFPNPESVARISFNDVDKLKLILNSLGFLKSRLKAVLKMSLQFCDVYDQFGEDWSRYDVKSFTGCGQYAADAWDLFVLKKSCAPKDRLLRDYALARGLYDVGAKSFTKKY